MYENNVSKFEDMNTLTEKSGHEPELRVIHKLCNIIYHIFDIQGQFFMSIRNYDSTQTNHRKKSELTIC